MKQVPTLNEEDAFHILVRYLRSPVKTPYSDYGYEFYIPNIVRHFLGDQYGIEHHEAENTLRSLSPHFYAAAWELCRRGIIRPGIKAHGEQGTADGASGNGYSITPRGRQWLQEAGQYDYVPTEPGRFSKILDTFTPRFGEGFRERSQEAIRCYGTHAYLACCAMCGAAAESIILAAAITKTSQEVEVLKLYSASGGRSKLENVIIGQQAKPIQDEFRGYSILLKYWRDSASHGKLSCISDNEAYTSLALLLRFAQFANDRWGVLVNHPETH
jgi:hypothetical protein